MSLSWTDVEDLGLELFEAHPGIDPTTVRFDRLRDLVEGLEEFEPEEGQRVNEQILEAIQAAWIEEHAEGGGGGGGGSDEDGGGDADEGSGYQPNTPFR
ncbi:MAG: Fe-S cluster assembly protein IscX [Planctomycetota bacterium]